jgi:hypothetical protein
MKRKCVQTYKDKRPCRRKLFESIKDFNAPPPYSLGGYYHLGALDTHPTNQHKNNIAGRWEDNIF